MKIVYGGTEPTIHPELGLLEPGVEKDLAPKDEAAAAAAEAAGLPLNFVATEGVDFDRHAQQQDDLVGGPPAQASREVESAPPRKKKGKE